MFVSRPKLAFGLTSALLLSSALVATEADARRQVHNATRTNVNSNVNRNRNVNVNRNTNVHRDIDVDFDHHHGGYRYGHGGHHHHPVATAVGVAAAATVTAVAIGSVVNTLPPSCSTMMVNGFTYQNCGGTYYQPRYSGTQVNYVVVNPPR